MMKLQGKVALVTGSSKGIGEGVVLRYAQEGANIVINYNTDREGAERIAREIESVGREVAVLKANIVKVKDIEVMFEQALEKFGHIDILVNNAGVEKKAPFLDVTEEDYDLVLDVNLKGTFFATQYFARHIKESGRQGGRVINMSSVHEEIPFPEFAAYCASKGGMRLLTRNLSIELAPLGITVNGIAPGAIRTPMNAPLLNDPSRLKPLLQQIPLNRLGEPEDVAAVAVFLASDEASYVTGSTYFVDGGLTWFYKE